MRPRPVPPNFLVMELSACVKASKIALLLLGGNANSRVANLEVEQHPVTFEAIFDTDGHRNFSPLGKLDGIADKIDNHLTKPSGIAKDELRHSRHGSPNDFHPFLLAARAMERRLVASISARLKSVGSRLNLPGFDFG